MNAREANPPERPLMTPDQLFGHAYATAVPNSPHALPGDPIAVQEADSWR